MLLTILLSCEILMCAIAFNHRPVTLFHSRLSPSITSVNFVPVERRLSKFPCFFEKEKTLSIRLPSPLAITKEDSTVCNNCEETRPNEDGNYGTDEYPSTLKSIDPVKALEKNPTWWQNQEFWRKSIALVLLTLQTSLLSLTMRWSHVHAKPHAFGKGYIPSVAVVCSELVKLLICFLMVTFYQTKTMSTDRSSSSTSISLFDLIDLAIPSALYVVQNNLQYFSMKVLPAAVYQVLAQMKLLVTAVMLSVLYHQRLSLHKWLSITLLTAGVAIVQVALTSPVSSKVNSQAHMYNLPLGVVAVAVSCLTSAYAGVRMEQTLKRSKQQSGSPTPTKAETNNPTVAKAAEFWQTNLLYALVSLSMSCLYALLKDILPLVTQNRISFAQLVPFLTQGFSSMVWLVIGMQAVGGILVSVVVAQTNSIVKSFATSAAIVLTALLSAGFFKEASLQHVLQLPSITPLWNMHSANLNRFMVLKAMATSFLPTLMFWAGTMLVCFSTVMYSLPAKKKVPVTLPKDTDTTQPNK